WARRRRNSRPMPIRCCNSAARTSSNIPRSRGLRIPPALRSKRRVQGAPWHDGFLTGSLGERPIELRRLGWMFGLGKRWTPGEKLKLLFAGYNGTRNTGSDVRVQEMLRQVRHVLG